MEQLNKVRGCIQLAQEFNQEDKPQLTGDFMQKALDNLELLAEELREGEPND